MTPERIAEIAEYYRQGKHEPNHPSYAVFVRETLEQWKALLDNGWLFDRTEDEPYSDSGRMFDDIKHKYLGVYTGGQRFAPNHPLAVHHWSLTYRPYGLWTVNEIFRAVHDVNGHGPTLSPFETFDDEYQATLNHKRMYSPEAWPALYGETLGQLCHYPAGYGFVEVQKAVVLPKEYWQ